MTHSLSDEQLLRYSRHILLDDIGIDGQQRLLGAHALIIGAGGLGCPAMLYLGSAGVGRITVVDDDVVDITNLQRQIAHTQARVGQTKVQSVQAAVAALNPDVQVHPLAVRADAALLNDLVAQADVVLDCSDNFATRQAVNAACVRHARPLVSGAAIRMDGQIAVYDSRRASSPCYACVFPPQATVEELRCATMGVFAPLVGVIGAMQAALALELLVACDSTTGQPQAGQLLMLDGRAMQWTTLQLPRNPACPVCASSHG